MPNLSIDSIRVDPSMQPRAQMDWIVVAEYAEAMKAGDVFPPVVVFYDGDAHWLADGFHRIRAAKDYAGLTEFPADVRQGSKRDAILFSVGANAHHGMRRSNEDKRKAVMTLLNDKEWYEWGDPEIARQCAVSDTLVYKLRPVSIFFSKEDTQRKVKRNGKEYTMNTTNIGKSAPQPEPEPAPDLFADALDDDDEQYEWVWTFDPETHVARCKYCYEQHSDWMHGRRISQHDGTIHRAA